MPHSIHRLHSSHFLLGLFCLLLFVPTSLVAQESGITVSVVGVAKTKPTQAEMSLTAGGSSELAGDAIVKYQDSLRRLTAAFEALKIENLQIVQQGLSYSESGGAGQAAMAAAFGGGNAQPAKSEVKIARPLRLVLRNIDRLTDQQLMEQIALLLDTAKDAGAAQAEPVNAQMAMIMASMGGGQSGSSMATFVVENAEAVRQQAYKTAFGEAQTRATRLADLAGMELAGVLAIEEEPVAAEPAEDATPQQRMLATIYGMYGNTSTAAEQDGRITSDRYEEITVKVGLRVRFAIRPKTK